MKILKISRLCWAQLMLKHWNGSIYYLRGALNIFFFYNKVIMNVNHLDSSENCTAAGRKASHMHMQLTAGVQEPRLFELLYSWSIYTRNSYLEGV